MMLDAETRAVYLAEEQMASGAWRRPDPDERVECDVTECLVCTKPLLGTMVWHAGAGRMAHRKPTVGQTVCTSCNKKGWRPKPCVTCGNPTLSWNWSSKKRDVATRGMCPKCRKAWHAEREMVG